ncbi:MAG: 1-acyl-sn-glycerol-3-phosphate acyltransferase [Verrucomicrobiae bacterium]|nr:1-acyl-sn-glycerol-3-phosphate acyltransferase [Verrucomicrobiae bacterium]
MRKFTRLVFRLLCLVAKLACAGWDYAWLAWRYGGSLPLGERALWLHRASQSVLRLLIPRIETEGPSPRTGLLVSNHLSYLDILVFAAIAPAVFVSKSEIKHWPVFGWFARMAGTIFVRRARRTEVGRIGDEIRDVLRQEQLVVLFPEGTTSNGQQILPFRSSLLEPVCDSTCQLTAAYVEYAVTDGTATDDVCYWDDMTFFRHLLRLMTKQQVNVRVRFAPAVRNASNRKDLARQLHAEVVRLKTSPAG